MTNQEAREAEARERGYCQHQISYFRRQCGECIALVEAIQQDDLLDRMREALDSMVWQFAYRVVKNRKRCLSTGGLSALEEAWEALGWTDDPHVTDAEMCERDGCFDWISCGLRDDDGAYVRLCSKHGVELGRRQRAILAEADARKER